VAEPAYDSEHPRATDLPHATTITSPAVTNMGVVLGTAAYMSPEQAKGQPADKRSDIWAFGCVLYEMLTGRKTFAADDITETLASVLTKEPEWDRLPPDVPAVIRTLLARCLERDRHKRIGDVAAVRFVLAEVASLSAPAPSPVGEGPNRRTVTMMTVATVAIAALAAFAGYRFRPVPPARALTFSILAPDGATFASTSEGGAPTVSPDGRYVAYVADSKAGRLLWVQSVDALDAHPLPGTDDANCPFWSADGSWLGFSARSEIKKISVTSGPPQTLGRAGRSARVCLGASANMSGTVLFSGPLGLASMSVADGEPSVAAERNIAIFDENHQSPEFLPDGRHYLLHVRGGPDLQFQLWVGQLGSNERRLLLKDVTNARYAPAVTSGPGYLVYVRGRRLVAHPFDETSMTLAGAPIILADGVAVGGAGALGDFDVSSTVLAYRRDEPGRKELVSYDRTGKEAASWGDRAGNPRNNVRISPDGKSAAFTRMGDAVLDVWTMDLDGGAATRFTLEGGRSPAWSPDGTHIAYLRDDTVYRKPFASGGPEVALWSGPGTLAVNDWSGDGKRLMLTRWDTSKPGTTGRGLWLLPNPLDDAASHEPTLLEAPALHGQFGPRIGAPRWVAYDAGQLFIRSMPDRPLAKWQVAEQGNASRWRADGREIFFSGGGSMMSAEIDPDGRPRTGTLRPLFPLNPGFGAAMAQYAPGWDVTPDGQRFLTTMPTPDTAAPAITIVMNWQSSLK
jgi:Tol biopolymer transport system component